MSFLTVEILETRKGMWAKVSARRHTVHKVFPFGNGSNEFMLYGVVNYTFKTGGQGTADWAGRAVLKEQDGVWRFKFYQVYLVSIMVILAMRVTEADGAAMLLGYRESEVAIKPHIV